MASRNRRKTPDELLRDVQAEEAAAKRGQLKIFLGYASGVGKSLRMFDEARRRRERGQDVVIGALQSKVPPAEHILVSRMESVPLRRAGDSDFVDVEALIQRHPGVCVIDGLAHDNPAGAKNPTRWQDVEQLLAAGIGVIASINIQYITEFRDEVESITGKRVRETVPVSFIKSAQEIEIVDAPAEVPAGGPSHSPSSERPTPNLGRLREMALVLAADVVDHQLAEYLNRHGIQQQFRTQERLMVCVTPRANIREMIETAQIIADRFHAELIAAYVNQPNLSLDDQNALEERLNIARMIGAQIEILEGGDPIATLLDFARSRGITQIFVGHTQRTGIGTRLWGSPIDKLIRLSRGIDLRIFPQ
jgi:two-component system sensor histidine kinase KdpD